MRRDIVGALACAVLVLAAAPGTARADALASLGHKLATLASETETLSQGIERPSDADRAARAQAERRLIEGQVEFGVGNYGGAALLLYDYVERYPDSSSHDDALYYLAESLLQKRDYMAARTFFTRLVTTGGSTSTYYRQSLERLVELSLQLDDSSDVDRWLQALDQLPPVQRRASVPYVRGKYAYFQHAYSEAIEHFAAVSPVSEYFLQARYFTGAAYIALGDLDKAVHAYAQLVQRPARTDDERQVIELAHMALGRLYYEREQPSQAIDEYSRIARTSELFDEALYEAAWVYVKSQQLDKALRALELLELADPSSAKLPEVRILEGNLRIRKAQGLQSTGSGNSAEEYQKALTAFETTRDTFAGPHAELAQLMARRADPRQLMAQMTNRYSADFAVRSTLPEVAVAWIRQEPEVQRVVGIEANLGEIAAEITEAERTIERLEQALASPSRVEIFPSLADRRNRAVAILEEILAIRYALADEQQALRGAQGRDRAKGAEIGRLLARSAAIVDKLDQIHTAVDEIVDLELADMRSSLAEEKARLAAYKRELAMCEAESLALGAEVLGGSLQVVKDKLYDVLARSEIGIIDVAWSRREASVEESQRLELDKLREVRTLREEFRAVLEEHGDEAQ